MKKLIAATLVATLLSACVPLIFAGGAAIGLWVGSDPRKAETIKDDFDLDVLLQNKIVDTYKDRTHVNVNVFNGMMLLSGEVPDDAAKLQVEQFAWQMAKKPRGVYNELTVAPPSNAQARAKDAEISARVKAAILAESKDGASVHLMVATEREVVYLMGVSTQKHIDRAAVAASKVTGVKQVVKLAEIEPDNPAEKK